jgi:glycerate 2-kinase
MKFLIATDSFKDSLSAYEVGKAAEKGILRAFPKAEVEIFPMADGGEGSVDILLYGNTFSAKEIEVFVHGPLMERVKAKYAVIEHNGEEIAFIESAQSSGLMLVAPSKRNPMYTTTYGLGEQIRDAVKRGYRHIVISLGGSATNDGGVGMLQALGWKFYDETGQEIGKEGNPLLKVASFSDDDVIPELRECKLIAASDVMNPFYGEKGAAYIFARQKGANESEIAVLDQALRKLAKLFEDSYGVNVQEIQGAGAAGGLGGAIVACLNGRISSGVETMIKLTRLEEKIKRADVVITGEGSLDNQSIMGKVPIGVGKLAKKHGKIVIGIAGRIDTELQEINQFLHAVFSIQTECRTLAEALQPHIAAKQIEVTVEQVVRMLRTGINC